ncbi:30S ribosomal protein S17 [Microgenomates group bacterium]|nr:30S ribosomal protein S17 [Microgenomates group bacterium]
MKKLQGTVVSLKAAKTASVNVTRRFSHPLFKKYVSRNKKYACHYENLDLQIGDTVEIVETKPISKTKHFRVSQVINK